MWAILISRGIPVILAGEVTHKWIFDHSPPRYDG